MEDDALDDVDMKDRAMMVDDGCPNCDPDE